jgi:hypothetical protein
MQQLGKSHRRGNGTGLVSSKNASALWWGRGLAGEGECCMALSHAALS